MKRLYIAVIAAGAAALLIASSVFASIPPGQRGYEGQPGNQGGYQQAGQKSYEGQPGNQSH